MFDAIKLRVYAATRPFDEYVPGCLARVESYYSRHDGYPGQKASLGNLRLTRTKASLVMTGSLAKWKHGHNVHSLSPGAMRAVLGELSELIGADLDQADVWSLEVGESLVMDHPAATYYQCLLDLPRYQRNLLFNGSTLLFAERHKSFQFYNKVSNAWRDLPEEFADQNLLRVEFKFKDRLTQNLKGRKVHGSDLYDEAFIGRMVRLWYKTYQAIRKSRNSLEIECLESIATPKDLSNALVKIALSRVVKPDKAMAFIHEARLRLTPRNHARMVAYIREMSQDLDILTTDRLIDELDQKMLRIAMEYCQDAVLGA